MDTEQGLRGFLLQPTYRIIQGGPCIYLYGRLESGESFLIRDGREVPRFYIRRDDVPAAEAEGARLWTAAGAAAGAAWRTLRGEAVVAVEDTERFAYGAAGRLADRLRAAGIATFEDDVRFPLRYLIDRGIRGALRIFPRDRPRTGQGAGRATGDRQDPHAAFVDRVFDEPDVAPDDYAPRLSVLSLDIETTPDAAEILSIGLYARRPAGAGPAGPAGPAGQGWQGRQAGDDTAMDEVLLRLPPGAACPPAPFLVTPVADEAALLRAFCDRVRRCDPDVLCGWNVIDFDLAVLERVSRRVGVPLHLGRGLGPVHVQRSNDGAGDGAGGRGGRAAARASVPGRVVLDGIQLLRGAFVSMEEYSLDHVARKVLGEGKALGGEGEEAAHRTGGDRAAAILDLYHRDPARFVLYNRTDARLALDVLERLRIFDLTVERCLLTGMPPDRVSASIAAFDMLYLTELSHRGVVAPSVRADEVAEATSGGHVLESQPGLYRNVLVFDFKSLYPSIIRTFQIDPLGHLPPEQIAAYRAARLREGLRGAAAEPIRAPNGAAFRREPGVLTQLLDELMPRREAARRGGDTVKSQAIKILMNSFYGVLGTPACRFYSPELANAITGLGQLVLLAAQAILEAQGLRVLYGDTDSLFADPGTEDPAAARALGASLPDLVNRELAAQLGRSHGVESRLELGLHALYLRLLLPRTRGGGEGARKRYAGLVDTNVPGEAPRLVFTGLEVVRRDWTGLAKMVQRQLYERLFSDQPVAAYLLQVAADVRGGRIEESALVYRKGLRKGIEHYTATTPPHVAAARKLGLDGAAMPRLMAYVVTRAGPEPAAERRSPIDHEHYLQKQVRPVAEPVLALLGLDFDQVIGDRTQLELPF